MDILYFFFVLLFMQLICCFIGSFVRLIGGGKNTISLQPREIFINLCIGAIALITCYSIFVTGGKTINWLFLVIGLMFIGHREKALPSSNKVYAVSAYPPHTFLLGAIISTFVLLAYYHYSMAVQDTYRSIWQDDYFVAQLSQFLNQGYENTSFFANFYGAAVPLSPYHYCETWLSAFIYRVFNLNALYTFSVLMPVFWLQLLVWGYFALLQNKRLPIALIALLILTFVFISDLAFQFKFLFGADYIWVIRVNNLIVWTKIIILSVYILFSAIFLLDKDYRSLFYAHLLLFPMSIAIVPAAAALIASSLCYDYYEHRVIRWNYILPFTIVLLVYACYALFGMASSISLTESNPIPYAKFRMLVTIPILYTVRYIPWIVLIVWLIPQTTIKLLKRYGFMACSYLLVTVLFRVLLAGKNHDADQFVSVANTAYLSVLFPVLLVYAIRQATDPNHFLFKRFGKSLYVCPLYLFVALIFVCSFISIHQSMGRKLFPLLPERIAYEKSVVDAVDFSELSNVAVYSRTSGLLIGSNMAEFYGVYGTYLDVYRNGICYWQVNIRDDKEKGLVPYAYELGGKEDNDLYRMEFIKRKQIQYMIVYGNANPSESFLKDWDLLASDVTTGERFYQLKKQ